VEACRRVRGDEDSFTRLNSLALGALYGAQGKYAEAESLDARSLEVCRRVLGDANLVTLMVVYNLADIYSLQGKFDLAQSLLSGPWSWPGSQSPQSLEMETAAPPWEWLSTAPGN
jgi:hypothetical protein